MHDTSFEEMGKFIDKYVQKNSILKIADVGSLKIGDCKTYRDLLTTRKIQCDYTGIDIVKGDNVDVVSLSPYDYPCPDNYFDIVISGQVIEHVARPWEWIKEIYRVTKVGGYICIIGPSEGKRHYNKDYWRILVDGMIELFEYAKFTPVNVYKIKGGKWKDCVGIGVKNI